MVFMKTKTLLLIFIILIFSVTSVAAQSTSTIYQSAKDSVVLIVAYDALGIPSSLGSGFFFEGYKIATNYHVIDGASKIVYKHIGSNQFYEIEKISSYSINLDLAILVTKRKGKPLNIGKVENISIGEKIIAIGNPRGLEGSVSEGIVSAIRGKTENKFFQITAPISPGSSGGPLFNVEGNVIGITTATLQDSQNLNFAMPAELLITLKGKLKDWEPDIGKDNLPTMKGSGGVELISLAFENVFGNIQFSLKNTNNKPINNISYILIFKDKRTGEVLHFIPMKERDVIPPRLSKRVRFENRNLRGFSDKERYPYKLGDGDLTALVWVELRVLTFDFVDNSPGSKILDSIL